MRSPDDVRLVINGREYAGWTGVSIDMAVDTISDAFSVSVPFDPSLPAFRDLRPRQYPRVEVYIGDDIILTGTLEHIAAPLTEDGRMLTLQGRSLTGPLNDCSIDGPLEYNGLALSTIASQVCKPFGIKVRADNDTNPIDLARADYGDTPARFLNSLAAPRLLLLNSSYDGKLVISWGRALKDRPVVADFTEGEYPLLSASATFDDAKVYSVYKAATQFAGEPGVVGTSRDASIKAYRPLLVSVGEVDEKPDTTAARLRAESEASAFSASASVAGWRRPDGKLWAERQAVTLLAPSSLLRTRAKYIVAGCTFTLSPEGKQTTFRLVLPETYSGEIPRSTPWE